MVGNIVGKPIISIIVPVYNVEKYLTRCIDSILNQTFSNFELILVDDGSSDKSGEICDEYAKNDKRIKVIHKENGGLSSARNAGLDIAIGRYIGFVDSDDYIDEKMYEILVNNSVEFNSDIVMCDYNVIFENADVKEEDSEANISNEFKVVSNIEALQLLYSSDVTKLVVACNKLYRRELFIDLRYELGRIHEDEFLIHKILKEANKIIIVNDKLYYYLQREGSIMNLRKNNLKRLDIIYAFEDRMRFFKTIKKNNLLENAEYSFIVRLFNEYEKGNKEQEELKIFKDSLKRNLFSLLKNNKFNFKEKSLWILFLLNNKLYDRYLSYKNI